jgi:hypothetical protein
MTTNYVLVDFENVQPESVSSLAGGAYHVLVFIGAAQAKGRISFELSHSIQMLGANAEYVQMARSGPNAMDMHIAYYIGKLLEQRPEAQIDVVSRDTDFDPLLEFLSARGFKVRRVKAIAEIVKRKAPKAAAPKPPVRSAVQKAQGPKKQAAPKSQSPKSQPPKTQTQKTQPPRPPVSEPYDKLDSIVKQLRSMSGKPANRRKLAQTITAYLRHHGGAPDARVVEEFIDELIRRKVVTVAGTKLNYTLG